MSKETQGFSRRRFLQLGATAAAATGAFGLSACSNQAAPAPEKGEAQKTDGKAQEASKDAKKEAPSTGKNWREAPAPIEASKIVETIDSDIVVIGAGMTGISAALRASELGASVSVVEKEKSYNVRGWFFGAVNTKWTKEAGIEVDEYEITRDWIANANNKARERNVIRFVKDSGKAIEWIGDKAVAKGLKPFISNAVYRGETYKEYPSGHLFLGGPIFEKDPALGPAKDTMEIAYQESIENGAKYYFKSPAVQLIKDGDKVSGCIAETEEGYKQFNAKTAVIIASGDIHGDKELSEELVPIANKFPSNYFPMGANTGDGLKMGVWAGAHCQEGPYATAVHPQRYSRQSYCFLFVNTKGERYMNEDTWVQAKSLVTAQHSPEEPFAWSIFDDSWREDVPESLKYGGGMFWDYHMHPYGEEWKPDTDEKTIAKSIEEKNGFQADTLEELADLIGVPKEQFLKTVERYNELCAKKHDDDFGKRPELMFDITKPPFTALKFGGALLCVIGGLEVNEFGQVLDDNFEPMPGLYAAGNIAGGLYGYDYSTLCLGNSHARCVLFGKLAAEHALGKVED